MNEEKVLYTKELISLVEIFPHRKIIKRMSLIKNKRLKIWIRTIIKILIKLNYEIYYLNGKIKVEEFDDYILCTIPIKEDKYRKKIISKWIKGIEKIVKQKKINNIIISEKLKNIEKINKVFVDDLKVEGKYLLKTMVDDVIEYISNIKNERIENQTISILVNEYSKLNLELIETLANKVKSVNIVTNSLRKFLIFESRLYENNGIMVTVSNNKRKGVSKANWIINVDFSEEDLKKYNINRNAIFINLIENRFEFSKAFSGIIINGLKIKNNINKNLHLIRGQELFNQTILYESTIFRSKSFVKIKEKIKQDNIKIQVLIGTKGELEECEYIKIA